MTNREALKIVDEATALVVGDRKNVLLVMDAIKVLAVLVDKEEQYATAEKKQE